jgi:hypothetical protein
VTDSLGDPGENDPDTAYQGKAKDGSSSFVVALKNKSDYIDIDYNYNLFQTQPTALIKINLT